VDKRTCLRGTGKNFTSHMPWEEMEKGKKTLTLDKQEKIYEGRRPRLRSKLLSRASGVSPGEKHKKKKL